MERLHRVCICFAFHTTESYRIFFILWFLILLHLMGHSQEFQAGLKGGLSLATIVSSNSDYELDNVGFIGGFHFGTYGSFELARGSQGSWRLAVEINYSQQGFTVKDMDAKQKLNYLLVPVLAHMTYHNKVNLHFGLQPGFLVAAKIKAGSINQDNKEEFTSADFSLVLGLGYHPNPFRIGARVNVALTGIEETRSIEDTSINNVVIHFYLAHTFSKNVERQALLIRFYH